MVNLTIPYNDNFENNAETRYDELINEEIEKPKFYSSKKELASYEFNLCNALTYQNLGVIELNIGTIAICE